MSTVTKVIPADDSFPCDIVLVAEECYPLIVPYKCNTCGKEGLLEYTDTAIKLFGGDFCDCGGYAPKDGYPSYEEWQEVRQQQLLKRKECQ